MYFVKRELKKSILRYFQDPRKPSIKSSTFRFQKYQLSNRASLLDSNRFENIRFYNIVQNPKSYRSPSSNNLESSHKSSSHHCAGENDRDVSSETTLYRGHSCRASACSLFALPHRGGSKGWQAGQTFEGWFQRFVSSAALGDVFGS